MKPILFNTEMVRAILDGRKTVTRRVVKPQPVWSSCGMRWRWKNVGWWRDGWDPIETITWKNTPYRPGDILYVRETWNYGYCDTTDFEFQYNETFFEELKPGSMKDTYLLPRYFYRTEDLDGIVGMKWRPSIHMPREAARIFMRVTDVRVERLQNITEEQARAEGVEPLMMTADVDKPDCEKRWQEVLPALPRFPEVWDRTIKPADRDLYGWDANPWVWVIEFDRCEKPQE